MQEEVSAMRQLIGLRGIFIFIFLVGIVLFVLDGAAALLAWQRWSSLAGQTVVTDHHAQQLAPLVFGCPLLLWGLRICALLILTLSAIGINRTRPSAKRV